MKKPVAKSRVRSSVITMSVYDTDILVVRGGKLSDAVRDYLRQMGEPEDSEQCEESPTRSGNFTGLSRRAPCLIWLKEDADIGIIAHESFHAVFHILTTLGVVVSDDSEEAVAYPLGWLVQEIVDKLFDGQVCSKKVKTKQKIQRRRRA